MKRAFSVSARRALSSPGRRRSHLPSQRTPKPPREDPATRTTDSEATRPWGAGAGVPRVCRKSFHKSHLGTCVTLTCSHSPGPGETRSLQVRNRSPRSPPTLRSPAWGSRSRGCDRQWEPRRRRRRRLQVLTGRWGSLRSRSPRLAAEGLRQDASSDRPGPPLCRQDAAVRRVGAPYWGPGPVPPATPPPSPEETHPPSACCIPGWLPFPGVLPGL